MLRETVGLAQENAGGRQQRQVLKLSHRQQILGFLYSCTMGQALCSSSCFPVEESKWKPREQTRGRLSYFPMPMILLSNLSMPGDRIIVAQRDSLAGVALLGPMVLRSCPWRAGAVTAECKQPLARALWLPGCCWLWPEQLWFLLPCPSLSLCSVRGPASHTHWALLQMHAKRGLEMGVELLRK